jgi:hypothetical protein
LIVGPLYPNQILKFIHIQVSEIILIESSMVFQDRQKYSN